MLVEEEASNFVQGEYDSCLEDAFQVSEMVDAALLQARRLLVLLVLLHLLHHPLKGVGLIIKTLHVLAIYILTIIFSIVICTYKYLLSFAM